MNKDASEFSLGKAGIALQPYLDHFPFRRMEDYVRTDPMLQIKRKVDGFVFHLHLYQRFTTIPATVRLESKAFAVEVFARIVGGDGPEITGLNVKRLIFMDAGSELDPGRLLTWFIQDIRYKSVDPAANMHMEGTSTIVEVDESALGEHIGDLAGFQMAFSLTLAGMLRTTIAKREKTISKLRGLEGLMISQMRNALHADPVEVLA